MNSFTVFLIVKDETLSFLVEILKLKEKLINSKSRVKKASTRCVKIDVDI